MTVSYNAAVSSVSAFTFFRLLLRWRGSIWKSILYELLLWIGLYYVVFVIYRYVLSHDAQGFAFVHSHSRAAIRLRIFQEIRASSYLLLLSRYWKSYNSNIFSGFLHDNELKDLEEIKIAYNKYWAPIHWAMNVCVKALQNKYLESPYAMIVVQNVVFLAVRSYFAICLVSRQFVLGEEPMFQGVVSTTNFNLIQVE
ncbi:hypothetical protein ANCDUO_13939 [Ancylostoma duodenale]|uniref:Bestrophin homolog n=1 Tax=Ancylostoma duodenale TaxID=51022 RepID=A0A0C2D1L8_9BILA|nr:hypothetical protein ANCDUO_13939 [Ancylostoma duodenale]